MRFRDPEEMCRRLFNDKIFEESRLGKIAMELNEKQGSNQLSDQEIADLRGKISKEIDEMSGISNDKDSKLIIRYFCDVLASMNNKDPKEREKSADRFLGFLRGFNGQLNFIIMDRRTKNIIERSLPGAENALKVLLSAA